MGGREVFWVKNNWGFLLLGGVMWDSCWELGRGGPPGGRG